MSRIRRMFPIQGSRIHPLRKVWDDDDDPECASESFVEVLAKDWTQSLHEALGNLREAMEERRKELAQVASLHNRLNLLESRVSALSKSGSLLVPITTFAPERFEILKEIKVVVQSSDEDFIATFFDANVSASGCNETEAVAILKDVILDRFDLLDTLPPEKLGPGPAKQIAVLRTFIRRRA